MTQPNPDEAAKKAAEEEAAKKAAEEQNRGRRRAARPKRGQGVEYRMRDEVTGSDVTGFGLVLDDSDGALTIAPVDPTRYVSVPPDQVTVVDVDA